MAKTDAPEKGTAWLAETVNEKCGTSYTSYQLRVLLRKLTKDGVIERGEGRYSFKGVSDPAVKEVIKAVKSGALDEDRKKGTEKAKAKSTKKRAAKKAKPEPVDEADDDEDDDIDEL